VLQGQGTPSDALEEAAQKANESLADD